MSEAIIVALITGGLSLLGVVVTCAVGNKRTTDKVTHKLEVHQAVTDTKIEDLTHQMNKHNNILERTYILEGKVAECQHDIKDLKAYHKPQHN